MHKKEENGNNTAESRDLETMKDQEGILYRKMPSIYGGGAC
jgi:hypothetical protein